MSRLRRNPRTERDAQRVAGLLRPRFSREAVAEGEGKRPRRDPRMEAGQMMVPGTARLRIDRAHRGSSPTAAARASVVEDAPTIRIIDQPAYLVAVVPDAPGGRLTPHDRQVLGAARLLADAGGGAVLALVDVAVDDLDKSGADRVIALGLEGYDPEAKAEALHQVLAALNVRHALLPESADGGDLARRLAALTEERLFVGAESLTAKAVTRAAHGRRIEQRTVPPRLITLSMDAVAPHGGGLHEARLLEAPPLSAQKSPILSVEFIPADPAKVSLAEAEFVVSAGNGVHDFDAFRALAAALRATPGASRMVCDAGLMPREVQVGASGTVLEASCYFALGIAGAPQHLQGITRCEHVVAVNTDLHAAMIERAGLAIVADAQQVMPALIALLAEDRS